MIPPELKGVLTRHGLTCDEKVNVYRAEYEVGVYCVTLDLKELADVILKLEDEAIAAVAAERNRCLAACHKVMSYPSDDEAQQVEFLIEKGE